MWGTSPRVVGQGGLRDCQNNKAIAIALGSPPKLGDKIRMLKKAHALVTELGESKLVQNRKPPFLRSAFTVPQPVPGREKAPTVFPAR